MNRWNEERWINIFLDRVFVSTLLDEGKWPRCILLTLVFFLAAPCRVTWYIYNIVRAQKRKYTSFIVTTIETNSNKYRRWIMATTRLIREIPWKMIRISSVKRPNRNPQSRSSFALELWPVYDKEVSPNSPAQILMRVIISVTSVSKKNCHRRITRI